MFKIGNFLIINSIIWILIGCANNNAIKTDTNDSLNTSQYKKLNKYIKVGDLDRAGEQYVDLKDRENRDIIKEAATSLALAHIAKKEYILANFFIQEGLFVDSSDELLNFLLVKNQFLAANLHNRDQSYVKKALNALESNVNLVTNQDERILSNTMLNRVKLDLAWSDKEIGNLYKKINKEEATKLYNQKVQNMGFDIDNIVKGGSESENR